jgi:hypothetical protein
MVSCVQYRCLLVSCAEQSQKNFPLSALEPRIGPQDTNHVYLRIGAHDKNQYQNFKKSRELPVKDKLEKFKKLVAVLS